MLLLLSEPCKLQEILSEILFEEGIQAFIATPDAGEALTVLHDVGGVILNGTADPIAADALCLRLLTRYPDLPVALLLPQGASVESPAARLLRLPIPVRILREELLAFCLDSCGCKPSPSTHALTLFPNGSVRYLGYSVSLPPHEASALRLLLFRSPLAVRHAELLSVCFPRSAQGLADLSDLISSLNRRFTAVFPEARLIESVHGFGYRLRDGIVERRE